MIPIPANEQKSKLKVTPGQLLASPGAVETMEKSGQSPAEFLDRHLTGDWGEVCEEDKAANDQSLIDGSRILSAYRTSRGEKLWIITEATDEDGHRSATTTLLPEEY